MTVLIVVNVLFIVLAVLFINVKATFLIAGYNTMPPGEKAEYDIVALSKFMGKTMFAVSGSLFLLILGEVFNSNGLSIAATILVVAISLFALIHTNTGNRFKKKAESTQL
jgi:preprotein translocase subunit SecY